jgi:hypothetical protein
MSAPNNLLKQLADGALKVARHLTQLTQKSIEPISDGFGRNYPQDAEEFGKWVSKRLFQGLKVAIRAVPIGLAAYLVFEYPALFGWLPKVLNFLGISI